MARVLTRKLTSIELDLFKSAGARSLPFKARSLLGRQVVQITRFPRLPVLEGKLAVCKAIQLLSEFLLICPKLTLDPREDENVLEPDRVSMGYHYLVPGRCIP